MSFTFNGTSSDTYNITVEKCPSYPVAQRVVEHIEVQGRNGDLIRDTGAWSNVDMTYSVYYEGSASFQAASHSIASWLNGSFGYCRLEDTYDPDVYRMAVMSNFTDYRNFLNKKGRADITFSCKPQRFLKSGEALSTVTSGTLSNPYMDCYPIYVVTGTGTVTIGGQSFFITDGTSSQVTYIDSETGECWEGGAIVRSQTLPTVILRNNLYPTATVPFTFNTTGLSNLYISNVVTKTSGVYRFGPTQTSTSSFSLTLHAWDMDYTVVKTQGSNVITYSISSGIGGGDITTTISSVKSVNGRVKGKVVGVPHGGTTVSSTFSQLRWIPRWWVL